MLKIKSKAFKFLIGTLAVVALAFAMNVSAAVDLGPTTLKVGSRGSYVMTLQTVVGATPVDGVFGPMTKAKVMAWQANNGLVADGIVGPATKAAMGGAVTTPVAEVPGCPAGAAFNYLTGAPCTTTPVVEVPGCPAGALFNYMTGAACGTTTGTPATGVLTGGAGDITVDDSNEYTNEDVAEGASDVEVLTFEVEADDESDVEITSVKVEFVENNGDSPDLDDYLDEVTIWFDGQKVGSADVDDFSESSDVWTKSISLNGVIVRAGDTEEITIAVSALNVIDSADTNGTADWTVDVLSVRFKDAEGVVTTVDTDADGLEQDFDVVEEGDGEALELKSSSNNPDASVLLVDADEESDWHEVLVFKVDAEESDIDLEELVLTVATGTEDYDVVVDEVKIEIDGKEFDDYVVTNGASQLATLTFDIDGDYTLDADTTEEITVMMTFRAQSGAYLSGSETVVVTATDISGEGVGNVSDSATLAGKTHTLSTSEVSVSVVSKSATTNEDDTIGYISFDFKVTAEDGDVTFDGDTDVVYDVIGTDDTIASATFTLISGDATDNGGNSYTILEGDNATFALDVTLTTVNNADNGTYRVRLETVAGVTLDNLSSSVNLANATAA